MVLEVISDWKVLLYRNVVFCQVVSWTNTFTGDVST